MIDNEGKVLAWHWLIKDRRLQYPPRTLVVPGQTLTAELPLKLCRRGLHASIRAIDSLGYAPGTVVCRVELSGEVVRGDDKLCAERRTVLWMADATRTLHEFACAVAESALDRTEATGQAVDPRSREAIRVKRAWLEGRATGQSLIAARIAAWAAVPEEDVTTRAAAWAAVWAADEDSPRSSAWSVDKESIRAVSGRPEWGEVRDGQDRLFEEMLTRLAN